MNQDLEKKWAEAVESGEPVPVGRIVVCDFCDDDWTDSAKSGGLIFQSNAVCPACAPAFLKSVESYHEEHLIKAKCPARQSFADFIREYRGPDATIQMTKGQ